MGFAIGRDLYKSALQNYQAVSFKKNQEKRGKNNGCKRAAREIIRR